MHAQKLATENVLEEEISHLEVWNSEEMKILWVNYLFFILETILIGKLLKINPFNQPSVELIKKETKKILA